MLKSFQRIKGLGVFADYAPPAGTAEFTTKNLIYGWNYSGKTALSRLVGMLETRQKNPELPPCRFSIATDAGPVTDANLAATPHVVRVFNADFVTDNLNFTGNPFKPILLLGAESDVVQREIERYEKLLARAKGSSSGQAEAVAAAIKALNAAKTASSAHIKTTIGIVVAFGPTQLDAELRTVALGFEDYALGAEAFEAASRLAPGSSAGDCPGDSRAVPAGAFSAPASSWRKSRTLPTQSRTWWRTRQWRPG